MEESQFRFETKIQMRWKDLDAIGHVNNATYLTYLEIARSQYIMAACPGWDWRRDMFLIGNVNLNFIREIKLTDQDLTVCVRTSDIGNKSFVLEYRIVSGTTDNSIIHASGTTTQIMFDMEDRKSIVIPDWVRKRLIDFDEIG